MIDVPIVMDGVTLALLAIDLELDLEEVLPPPPTMGSTAGGCQLRLDADRRDDWERREEAERADGDKLLLDDMISAQN